MCDLLGISGDDVMEAYTGSLAIFDRELMAACLVGAIAPRN